METDVYSGTISLYFKGELIDRKRVHYNGRSKSSIINQWKHKYGRKYFDPQVSVKIEKDIIQYVDKDVDNTIRVRNRNKIPSYFIHNLKYFYLERLIELKNLVDGEIILRQNISSLK